MRAIDLGSVTSVAVLPSCGVSTPERSAFGAQPTMNERPRARPLMPRSGRPFVERSGIRMTVASARPSTMTTATNIPGRVVARRAVIWNETER
jgi:hypothetical protein